MHELALSVREQLQMFQMHGHNKQTHKCFQFYPEKATKASGTPRSEVYASFIGCRHSDKPSL